MKFIERLALRWLDHWFSNGDTHQWRFYRCVGCRGLVTWNAIRQGGCPCKLSSRMAPAALTRWEKVRLLVTPWTVR